MKHLFKIISFKIKSGNCGGALVQFQPGDEPENALPFSIGKVLVSSDMQPGDVRGKHAHYATEEIVVALSGGCTFELEDGRGTRECVRLSAVAEDGGLGTEDGGLGTEDGGLGTEDGGRRTEDGDRSSVISRRSSDIKEGLLLYPHIWRTFYDFEPGTVLLIVANMKYDETDYIRDYEKFKKIAVKWTDLGGSSTQNIKGK